MNLEWLEGEFSVAKWTNGFKDMEELGEFVFWAKTDTEVSLLCKSQSIPIGTQQREDGWKGFRVCGQLDFSLIGIMSKISACLAAKKISIFAVSTFDTDYIFLKKENASCAQEALEKDGWIFL